MQQTKAPRVVAIKNISGDKIPKHDVQCSREKILNDLGRGAAGFCPDCEIPTFDSHQIMFAKDEEIVMSENAANHLIRTWRGKFKLMGEPQDMMNVYLNPLQSGLFQFDGKQLAPKRIEMPQPRTDPNRTEDLSDVKKAGRYVAEVVT